MQTLADFAEKDEQIKPRIRNLIKGMIKNGSPAIISRGKKLLKQLN
jgi:DNA primase